MDRDTAGCVGLLFLLVLIIGGFFIVRNSITDNINNSPASKLVLRERQLAGIRMIGRMND